MILRVIQPKAVTINCDKHACRLCPFVVRASTLKFSWQCTLFDKPLTMTPSRMPRRCDECKLAEVKP
jgi:hypothetical protein